MLNLEYSKINMTYLFQGLECRSFILQEKYYAQLELSNMLSEWVDMLRIFLPGGGAERVREDRRQHI